jgi:N-acetylmuramoyl-L-alanine amidase CwlA
MNIIERLIPDNLKPKYTINGKQVTFSMIPEYITIHETDNKKKGASAEAHARLQSGGNSRQASWHFQVDDKQVIQSLRLDEAGIHAGDGANGTGNRKSIAIEICVNEDGDYKKALNHASELVGLLMNRFNIPIDKVVPHKKWSGKNCPRNLLDSGWKEFIKMCEGNPKQSVKSACVKTGSMPIELAEKIAADVKQKYGLKIVHVIEA